MLDNDLEIKQECIKRMKLLRLQANIIEEFKNNDTIYVSELRGSLKKATKQELELLKEYEAKKPIKVYHISHFKTENRDIYYYLYVSTNSDEWKSERKDMSLGFTAVICYKKTKELIEVGIRTKEGKISQLIS